LRYALCSLPSCATPLDFPAKIPHIDIAVRQYIHYPQQGKLFPCVFLIRVGAKIQKFLDKIRPGDNYGTRPFISA
jgi:hypothetical protein